MITREQVADLRAGDVVELRPDHFPLVSMRGPLHARGPLLFQGHVLVRSSDGVPGEGFSLTVIERAPRLYVNHDRAEPVPGDVVRFECVQHPDDSYTDVYLPLQRGDRKPWVSLTLDTGERYSDEDARCDHLDGWHARLLVDGTTGQVVP